MGAQFVKMVRTKQWEMNIAPREKGHIILEIDDTTAPDYRFEEFVTRCEKLQREKRTLEARLRAELNEWSEADGKKASSEQKHAIFKLLADFRTVQEQQNELIQKEKVRFQMLREEHGDEGDQVRKMRNRLKYFIALNKEHAQIIARVREDAHDCQKQKSEKKKSRTRVDAGSRC